MPRIKHCPGNAYPLGISPSYDGLNFAVHAPHIKEASLLIYEKGCPALELPMPRVAGEVCAITVSGLDAQKIAYHFLLDGEDVFDVHAKAIAGGSLAAVPDARYCWGRETRPNIDKCDVVMYEMLIRAFGGDFKRAMKKIPHLVNLGVNAVMLMPVFDYDESVGGWWGYAPKALCALKDGEPKGFKKLINALHQRGIEVYIDLGMKGLNRDLLEEAISWYASEYHVDGFKIADDVNRDLPHLMGLKWFGDYDSEFTDALRRFVKGESGLTYTMADKMEWGGETVHCAACHDGLTLFDWAKDEKAMKNALTLTLLGRGIPLLLMGDEMGRTQDGNANAYDERWPVDFERGETFQALTDFTARLIALRKECTCLRKSLFDSDFPPVSCHSATPWQGDFFGVTLCMLYAGGGEYVYVMYNGGAEDRVFTLPDGIDWRGELRTDDKAFDEGMQNVLLVPAFTAMVLKGSAFGMDR